MLLALRLYARLRTPFREEGFCGNISRQGPADGGSREVVTSGFRQGAGLVVDTLVPVGGAVGVEAPTYNGFLGILRAKGCEDRAHRMRCGGNDSAALEKAMAEQELRLVYSIPTYHNPTGRNMSLSRRREILRLCAEHDVPILGGRIQRGAAPAGNVTPPSALRGSEGVAHAGSFLRCCFRASAWAGSSRPKPLYRYLTHEKYNQDIHTPPLYAGRAAAMLHRGSSRPTYQAHARALSGRLDALYDALDRHFAGRAKWARVEAGFPPGSNFRKR